jgi:hypothetical protein
VSDSETRAAAGETLARAGLWLALGGWVGSWLFFALVVARTAFRVLPSTELGGRVVAPALAVLHWYGVVAGVLVAGIAWKLRRARACVLLPLAMAALCAYSESVVTGEMEELRPRVFGEEGDEKSAERYRTLHGRSMGLFSAVALGAIALTALHARSDALDLIEARAARKT